MANNKSEIIKARHISRTVIKNINGKPQEVPVEMEFTQKAWDHMGSVRIDGKIVPKQGFVRIADVATPPEAKTPTPPPADPVKQDPAPPVQTTPPAAETKQEIPNTNATSLNIAEIEASIKAEEKEKLPMMLLLQYIKATNLPIEAPEKMPQHELISKIKLMLK